MKIGMVGLGKMGMNMARRLLLKGQKVVAFNRSPEKVAEIMKEGAEGAHTLGELVAKLDRPRVIWLMLPAGRPVDDLLEALIPLLAKGDTIVEGGNSFYKDDIRREGLLRTAGMQWLDAGVSGGVWGLKNGYCLMLGGERQVYDALLPLFEALAPQDGYLYCGPAGAGHFVKMIHNGIEYGMMSAYGEGFEILNASPYGSTVDPAAVAHLWNQGSVVRSWLLELAEEAFKKDGRLETVRGFIEDSGEGRWTVQQAIDSAVPAPVITAALYQRFRSRQDDPFADRLLAALRNEFGGHAVQKKGD
ncbi:MAG: decarboxylating 6-phosphogluconate dehydrogenase [Nitrospirae bacterium]|nr:MAG: decarboxylating 6-phosphogluconate dehydrogenase [Nitrospirota bacterium]